MIVNHHLSRTSYLPQRRDRCLVSPAEDLHFVDSPHTCGTPDEEDFVPLGFRNRSSQVMACPRSKIGVDVT